MEKNKSNENRRGFIEEYIIPEILENLLTGKPVKVFYPESDTKCKEKEEKTSMKTKVPERLLLPEFVEDALNCYKSYLMQKINSHTIDINNKKKSFEEKIKATSIDDEVIEILNLGLEQYILKREEEYKDIMDTVEQIDRFMSKCIFKYPVE